MIGNDPELTILMLLHESLQSKKNVSMKWTLCWGKIIDLFLFFLFLDSMRTHRCFLKKLQWVTVALHHHQNTSYSAFLGYTLCHVGFTLNQGAYWRGGFFIRRWPETHLSPINTMNVVLFFMWRTRPWLQLHRKIRNDGRRFMFWWWNA